MNDTLLIDQLTTKGFLYEFDEDYSTFSKDIFPRNGDGIVYYKGRFNGYSLRAFWINGKKEGDAKLVSDNGITLFDMIFVDDNINGMCCIHNKLNELIFYGRLTDGMKNGICVIYNKKEKETVIIRGMYEMGRKLFDFIPSAFDPNLWIERHFNGEIICISNRSVDLQNRDGRCVEYDSDGRPTVVTELNNRIIVRTLKTFLGDVMTEFDDNNTPIYKGGYLNNYHLSFPRHGNGIEMDQKGVQLFNGTYDHGVREGDGTSFVDGRKEYSGEWHNGHPEGKGQWFDPDSMNLLYKGNVIGRYEEVKKYRKYKNVKSNKSVNIVACCIPSEAATINILGVSVVEIPTGEADSGEWYLRKEYGNEEKKKNGLKMPHTIINVKKGKKILPIMMKKGMQLKCGNVIFNYPVYFLYILVLILILLVTSLTSLWIYYSMNVTVTECDQLSKFSSLVMNLKIINGVCDSDNSTQSVNFAKYSKLKSVIIGDDCFKSTTEVMFDGLRYLKTLTIGKNSFTTIKNFQDIKEDKTRSFHITNCPNLNKVEIGNYSFSDYYGFKMKSN